MTKAVKLMQCCEKNGFQVKHIYRPKLKFVEEIAKVLFVINKVAFLFYLQLILLWAMYRDG